MQYARDDQARGATVDVVTWTGRDACALQQALRMTNDDFADLSSAASPKAAHPIRAPSDKIQAVSRKIILAVPLS